MGRNRSSPTVQEVAAAAGVSTATVSRVLSGRSRVQPDTRARVETAMTELDYRPSHLARDLRRDRSMRVLVLFPFLHSPVMSEVFRGLDDAACAHGYLCMICPTAKDRERERELVQLLTSRTVDGLIFFGSTLPSEEIDELGRRYSVAQCGEWKDAPHTSIVSVDDRRAAYDAATHLIEHGHSRIAMLGNRSETSGLLREGGYREALDAAGLTADPELFLDGDYEYATGYRDAARLLKTKSPPTAVFCVNDVVAAGCLNGARSLGHEVPGDLAVVGFDDSREATMALPQITTVRQPAYDIGHRAMGLLVHNMTAMDAAERTHERVVFPHELVVRDSTGRSPEDRPQRRC